MSKRAEGPFTALAGPFQTAAAFLSLALVAVLVSCAGKSTGAGNITEVDVLMKRGDGYYFNERFEEAEREYSLAVAAAPRKAPPYRSRGQALMAMGQSAAARADFDRAVALDPSFAEAFLARGVLSYREKKFAEAIDDFDRVIVLDPWSGTARYYKAISCERVGRLREAVEAYKGYIHCTVPREDAGLEQARERIEALEKGPLP